MEVPCLKGELRQEIARIIAGAAGLVLAMAVILSLFALPPGKGYCDNIICEGFHRPDGYAMLGGIYGIAVVLAVFAWRLTGRE